ncbi:MAG TPA: hypothetical protein VK014_14290 [Cyclobacteriaceae bacterium]|nr:hypothetical protein [Cyclobacteriaceae bacterium]
MKEIAKIMKKLSCLLVAGLLVFGVSEAQDVKGPKAKNYKPWKEQAKKGTIVVYADEPAVKGPSYKNKKAWEAEAVKVNITSPTESRQQVTGPKAKNRKVWKKE